jgi:cell division septation protein DedD
MDGSMRDLNLIREKDDAESGVRRLALLGLAAGATMVLVLALVLEVGASAPAAAEADDPLAALARVEPSAVPEGPAEAIAAQDVVDPLALTFPERLAADGERPEVAAALAAAAAELAHPDPVIDPLSAADLAARIPAVLPASVAATTEASTLARVAVADPMVRDAIPEARVGEAAPEGHDGEFTVQVISYDSPDGAHAFAAGLRARGHRAYVMQAEVPGRGTVYRVRIGPFETMASATAYRHEFEASEQMNTIVVRRRS